MKRGLGPALKVHFVAHPQTRMRKIIKSNPPPSTTMPTKPCPEVPQLHLFWTPPGMGATSLGSLFQCLTTPSVKEFSLISNRNLSWCNLRPLPLVLSLVSWEKRPNTCLTTTTFEVTVESNKVSPQAPLLQAKQPYFPQLLLIRLVL